MTWVQAFDNFNDMAEFDVDFSTGEVVGVGLGALRVKNALKHYGGAIGFPQQQSFEAPHPSIDPRSMAWLLMSMGFYDIRGDLAQYDPPEFSDIPDGAVS